MTIPFPIRPLQEHIQQEIAVIQGDACGVQAFKHIVGLFVRPLHQQIKPTQEKA